LVSGLGQCPAVRTEHNLDVSVRTHVSYNKPLLIPEDQGSNFHYGYAHDQLTVCSRYDHSQITVCSWYDHRSRYVHGTISQITVCSRYDHGQIKVCSWYDHSQIKVCSRYDHSQISVCSRYGQSDHGMLTVKSQSENILGLYLDASVHTNDNRHVTVRSRERIAEP